MIALVEAYREGLLKPPHWSKNIVAGVVVGVVALPLAMAFAIASGVTPANGIYTAILAGLLVSVCGGSRVQIAGPTGAFIVLLSSILMKHGLAGLQLAWPYWPGASPRHGPWWWPIGCPSRRTGRGGSLPRRERPR